MSENVCQRGGWPFGEIKHLSGCDVGYNQATTETRVTVVCRLVVMELLAGVIEMSFLWFILIGIVAGWLAGQIMKSGTSSLITDLIVGVIGAIVGGFLFGLLGLSASGLLGSLVTATVGAVVLIAVLRAIKR